MNIFTVSLWTIEQLKNDNTMLRKTQSFSQWTMIACNNWYSDHISFETELSTSTFQPLVQVFISTIRVQCWHKTLILINTTVYKATQKTTMDMSLNEFTDLPELAAHRVVNKMYRNGTTTAVVYRTVRWLRLRLYVLASNACDSTPCQNGATCEEAQGGGYSCTCIAGFDGDDCETGMQIIDE